MERRRRARTTRAERGKAERRAEWIRLIWWSIGFLVVIVFMLQSNLMNATGVLAVLGVIEVVAKAWKRLGEKFNKPTE